MGPTQTCWIRICILTRHESCCVHITVWEALMWESQKACQSWLFLEGSLVFRSSWLLLNYLVSSLLWLIRRQAFLFHWDSNAPSEILPQESQVGGSYHSQKHQHLPFLLPWEPSPPDHLGLNNLLMHHNCCSWGGGDGARRGYLSATLSFPVRLCEMGLRCGLASDRQPPTPTSPYPILAVNQEDTETHS